MNIFDRKPFFLTSTDNSAVEMLDKIELHKLSIDTGNDINNNLVGTKPH